MNTFIHSFITKAAFLAGVLLLVTTGCDNQTAVDSLQEPEDEQIAGIKEGRIPAEGEAVLKPVPLSEITLSEHMRELLKKRGIASDQILFTEFSDSGDRITEKRAFEETNTESEVGLMYMIDPCFEPLYGGDIDCDADLPSPPPAPGRPQPPINPSILIALDSFIQRTGGSQVRLGSWSAASQNIDYIGVAGESLRDNQFLAARGQGRGNASFAGVVYSTSKPGYPYSAEMYWRQVAEHYFEHNGIPLILFSSESMYF